MPTTNYTITPALFKGKAWPVSVSEVHVNELQADTLSNWLGTEDDATVGLSAVYGPKCVLTALALATRASTLLVRFSSTKGKSKRTQATPDTLLLESTILLNGRVQMLAFDAERVATALWQDYRLHINNVVDVQSLATSTRWSINAYMNALGGSQVVRRDSILDTFLGVADDKQKAICRAWASWSITEPPSGAPQTLAGASPINTTVFSNELLDAIAKLVRHAERLTTMKPTKVRNNINPEFRQVGGEFFVEQLRYKTQTRAHRSQNQIVLHVSAKERRPILVKGRVTKVDGRKLDVASKHKVHTAIQKLKVYTFGKEDPTNAEAKRISIIVSVLQQQSDMFSSPLARAIFLGKALNSSSSVIKNAAPVSSQATGLNSSQKDAVNEILSLRYKLGTIHGPPGTGKTLVIARAVEAMINGDDDSRTVWLLAQSNVAVKNIAEKLASIEFWDFKLLVSQDFHYDWHEHLYHRLDRNVIRSDQFGPGYVGTSRLLTGVRVILCTISMISSTAMIAAGFTHLVPVDTVIVDEASQIEVGDYLPLLSRFGKSIRKIVFIGDDKQLPPYGQDNIDGLQSIFEIKHLRRHMVFLDTQYRMPVRIGSFLSLHMYGGRLRSVHPIKDKKACVLVDVSDGVEVKIGQSWKNLKEADIAVKIATDLLSKGKRCKIITPYDGQRALIEATLKSRKMPWEDTVFCVDSFQGSEDDHIIVSVVRTEKIGFLSNRRRSNVMLSRCKRRMFICTNRTYVTGTASSTLLGQLAKQWGESGWMSWPDLAADIDTV